MLMFVCLTVGSLFSLQLLWWLVYFSDDLEKDDIFQQMKNSYENYKKSKDYVFHQNIENYNKSKNNIFQRMKNSFENELTQQMKNSIENGENSKQCSSEKKVSRHVLTFGG